MSISNERNNLIGNVEGAVDTAANFSNLDQRISKLEEKNKELEQRISVLEKTKQPESAAPVNTKEPEPAAPKKSGDYYGLGNR